MKKLSLIISLLISLCAWSQVEKYIPAPPVPPRLVNDLTAEKILLTASEREMLERKLVAYDDSTSNQIVIVIVDDLHGYAAVDYAVALGRKWGVGGKEYDNGIVILVSTGGGSGNRDAFISTGYGLEGAIPDMTANTILETALIPGLKSGNYFEAFNNSIDAMMKAAAGEYKAPPGYRKTAKEPGKGLSLGKIVIALIILSIFMGMGGGRGNRGGGYMSRRGSSWLGPMILGSLLGRSGGGGGFGGGGFGGGGGGFGGFGGGGFGGGGAGGKW